LLERAVVPTVDGGVLEEFAGGDAGKKVLLLEEIIILAVDLAGARNRRSRAFGAARW
jgi:hypothetical protein